MIGVVPNVTDLIPFSIECSDCTGMFETAIKFSATSKVTSNLAFLSGSSQQGNALLASVDSNCVAARNVSSPSMFR